MVDSFSWKHWKNIAQEPDWDNLQIEVVDVWHFIISLAIEDYSKNLRGGIEDLAMNLSQLASFEKINTQNSSFGEQEEVIKKVENIIRLTLEEEKFDLEKIIGEFFDLVLLSGLDLETLYRLYVGKNVLNQFRQDHGYKDGSYIKIWGEEEDNVVMKRIWEEDNNIKPEMLYKELSKIYCSFNKS
jgi:hypothetical protein